MLDLACELGGLDRRDGCPGGRPVFHSEADFQYAFAWELQRTSPSVQIRLETLPVRASTWMWCSPTADSELPLS